MRFDGRKQSCCFLVNPTMVLSKYLTRSGLRFMSLRAQFPKNRLLIITVSTSTHAANLRCFVVHSPLLANHRLSVPCRLRRRGGLKLHAGHRNHEPSATPSRPLPIAAHRYGRPIVVFRARTPARRTSLVSRRLATAECLNHCFSLRREGRPVAIGYRARHLSCQTGAPRLVQYRSGAIHAVVRTNLRVCSNLGIFVLSYPRTWWRPGASAHIQQSPGGYRCRVGTYTMS